jgi:hypothetical protein
MTDIPQAVAEAYKADQEFSRKDLAEKLGVNVRTVLKHLARLKNNGASPASPATSPSQCNKLCLKTIRITDLIDQERLDARKILRDGLAAIPKGELAYDENLCRDLRISRDRWRDITRDDEWSVYRAVLPNRKTVWGKPDTIADLKRQDGVQ